MQRERIKSDGSGVRTLSVSSKLSFFFGSYLCLTNRHISFQIVIHLFFRRGILLFQPAVSV